MVDQGHHAIVRGQQAMNTIGGLRLTHGTLLPYRFLPDRWFSPLDHLRYGLVSETRLALAGPQHRAGAQAVLVRQRPFKDAGDDLHVPAAMRPNALTRPHPVLVDDPEYPEAQVLRVVVVVERDRVAGVQPTMIPAVTHACWLF